MRWKSLDVEFANAIEDLAFTQSRDNYCRSINSLLRDYSDDCLRLLARDVSPRMMAEITSELVARELSK